MLTSWELKDKNNQCNKRCNKVTRAVTLLLLLSLPLCFGISTSGCGVQRYSHGTLEWEPTHGRAVLTWVVPTAPSSESCDFVVFVVLPFSFGISTSWCDLWAQPGFSGIYPSPLLFSVTCAVRLPVWGLMAGISGLPATGRLPALHSTQLPYTMLLFIQG